jgi:glutamyl/glutaminyl-tRNA synthetase
LEYGKEMNNGGYRGRLAPTPTGYLHRGHARTFLTAQERARERGGKLILRIEDLDRDRCKSEFAEALIEDLKWAGLSWEEGPDIGGPFQNYRQSERLDHYRDAWRRLRESVTVFPCDCSRKDVRSAAQAPHSEGSELIYPGFCRDKTFDFADEEAALAVNWRFRVPAWETIAFEDGKYGRQNFMAGRDFGDFLIWRKDGIPSYELAVVVDDIAMGITEVVRGEDLLMSTARQLLIYDALGVKPPAFYHCPLVRDEKGKRLAKRDGASSLRDLRRAGMEPSRIGLKGE